MLKVSLGRSCNEAEYPFKTNNKDNWKTSMEVAPASLSQW